MGGGQPIEHVRPGSISPALPDSRLGKGGEKVGPSLGEEKKRGKANRPKKKKGGENLFTSFAGDDFFAPRHVKRKRAPSLKLRDRFVVAERQGGRGGSVTSPGRPWTTRHARLQSAHRKRRSPRTFHPHGEEEKPHRSRFMLDLENPLSGLYSARGKGEEESSACTKENACRSSEGKKQELWFTASGTATCHHMVGSYVTGEEREKENLEMNGTHGRGRISPDYHSSERGGRLQRSPWNRG